MENGFFLITGTSRGIGEALAQQLLEKGNTVLGVARGRSDTLKSKKYHHLAFDLADTARISRIMAKVDEVVANQRYDFICLVNNASAVEPLGSIERCPPSEIESHIKIGLIAPMILTSLFIRKFSGDNIRKKVAFISSGSAYSALPHESIYCGTKAGINMFAQCVGLEQKDKEYGFEVIRIRPGTVDTSMQQVARSKNRDEYMWVDVAKQMYEKGELEDPAKVAERICSILDNQYHQGQEVNAWEV